MIKKLFYHFSKEPLDVFPICAEFFTKEIFFQRNSIHVLIKHTVHLVENSTLRILWWSWMTLEFVRFEMEFNELVVCRAEWNGILLEIRETKRHVRMGRTLRKKRYLQGNIPNSESPILMKFGTNVVFEKIFDPYFFYLQWLMLKGWKLPSKLGVWNIFC